MSNPYLRYDGGIDINTLIRAAIFYYQKLNNHINGTESLAKEMIEYYANKLLEITLKLENIASDVYDNLSDDEKELLEIAEEERNKNLFTNATGEPLKKDGIQLIMNVLERIKQKDEETRRLTNERLNNLR